MNEKKTASSLLQRNGLKTSALIRDDVSADIEKEGENDSEDNDDEEVVSLDSPERDTTTTKPSTTKPLKSEGKDNWEDKWSKAKVTQYFSWETPSDEEVTVSSQETTTPSTTPRSQSSRVSDTRIKGSNKKRVAAQRQTTTTTMTTEEPTTTFNPPRSAAVKTTKNISSQRIRVSSIGPTTRRPVTTTQATSSELESNEEDVPSTTRTPKLEALRQTYDDWSQEAVQDKLLLRNKGSSTSFQSGTGYGWTANIDHSNQKPAQVRTTTSTTKGNIVSSSEEQPDQPKILEVDHEADNDANDRVNDDSEVIDDVTTEPPAFTRIKSNQKSNQSQRKGIKRRGSLKGKTFQRQQIQQLRETTTERTTTEREETTTTTTTTTTTKRPTTSAARLQIKGRLQSKTNSRQRQAVTTPTTKGLPKIVEQRQVAVQVKVSGAIKTSQGVQYIDNDQVVDQQDNNSFQENEKISQQEVKGGKFSKKSGVEYTSSSIEREEDISVNNKGNNYESNKFNQRSGQQIDTENEDCRLEDAIPGLPLRDYPTYDLVPETSFRCSDHSLPGYYGDVEAQCQVFHVCQADGRKNDFLCPVGTVFNQEHFVCDWWQNFRCQDTPSFYSNNELLYNTFGTNNNLLQNTQLRKRTDSIEREEVEREVEREAEGEEVISGEVDDGLPLSQDEYQRDDDQQESKEGTRQSNQLDAEVKGSLKGNNKRSGRQRQSDVSSGIKSARVSASYGARLAVRSSDKRRSDNWAAASEAKLTSDNDVVTTTTNSPTTTTTTGIPTTTTNTVAPLVLRNTTTSPKQTVDRFHLLHMMTSLPIPV